MWGATMMKVVTVVSWMLLLIPENPGLGAKKLEEVAYQASDKVYGKDDAGPYDCLRWAYSQGTVRQLGGKRV